MELSELARIFDDDAVKVSATKGLTPQEVLSDEDLARITDRLPGAYESQSAENDRFRIVEEHQDQLAI